MTNSSEFEKFDATMRKVLSVSREELKAREAKWKADKLERSATRLKGVAAKRHERFMDRLAAKLGPQMKGHIHFNRSGEDNVPMKVLGEEFQRAARRKVN